MRGAGTSIAGNAVGTGIVVDTSRHLNQVRRPRPRRSHGDACSRAPCTPLCSGPPPHTACASAPTPRPTPAARSAAWSATTRAGRGARLRPHRRQRRRPRRLSPRPVSGTLATRGGRAARRSTAVDRVSRRPAPSSAGSAAQVSGYAMEHLLPENGRDVERFLVGSEGTLALVLGDRAAGRGRASARARGARLPVDGRGSGRRTGAAAARPGRLRGDGPRIPALVRRRGPRCPMPRPRLAVRRADRRLGGRGAGSRRARRRRQRRRRRTGWSPTPSSSRAVAHPRGRRGLARAHARPPGAGRVGGRRRAA